MSFQTQSLHLFHKLKIHKKPLFISRDKVEIA